jgi:indole-3-glycerol phosphate synthase
MTILDEIFAHKRDEVSRQKRQVPLPDLLAQISARPAPLDFASALRGRRRVALIAEVKRCSPSKGILLADFNPVRLAEQYAANGAAAISVLTDQEFFGGSLQYLSQIAALRLGLPLLRKEFICDPYQIYEARAAGADAILLIVASLSDHELQIFLTITRRLSMSALVEVHNLWETARAIRVGAAIIGINNRDLRDFTVRLSTTHDLRPGLPPRIVAVAESGIANPRDVQDLGVDAILVGEALVRAADIGAQVRLLSAIERSQRAISNSGAAEPIQ